MLHSASEPPSTSGEVLIFSSGEWVIGYYDFGRWRVVNNGDYHWGGHGNDYPTVSESDVSETRPYAHPTHWQELPPVP